MLTVMKPGNVVDSDGNSRYLRRGDTYMWLGGTSDQKWVVLSTVAEYESNLFHGTPMETFMLPTGVVLATFKIEM